MPETRSPITPALLNRSPSTASLELNSDYKEDNSTPRCLSCIRENSGFAVCIDDYKKDDLGISHFTAKDSPNLSLDSATDALHSFSFCKPVPSKKNYRTHSVDDSTYNFQVAESSPVSPTYQFEPVRRKTLPMFEQVSARKMQLFKDEMIQSYAFTTVGSIGSSSPWSTHAPTKPDVSVDAVLMTSVFGDILTINEVACRLFGADKHSLIGQPAISLLDFPHREKIVSLVREIRQSCPCSDNVFMCGKLIRVRTILDQSVPVALWLKYKTLNDGECILIWVLKEVEEIQFGLKVNNMGTIISADETFYLIFGYSKDDHLTISDIVPFVVIQNENNAFDIKHLSRLNYFTCRTISGVFVPLSMEIPTISKSIDGSDVASLQLQFLPNIAGCLIVTDTGNIKSYNNAFVKHLFGFSAENVVGKPITDLIPHFWDVVAKVDVCYASDRSKNTAENSPTSTLMNTPYASGTEPLDKVAQNAAPMKSTTTTAANLPQIQTKPRELIKQSSFSAQPHHSQTIGRHRDGNLINISLHLRIIGSGQSYIYVTWIQFSFEIAPSSPLRTSLHSAFSLYTVSPATTISNQTAISENSEATLQETAAQIDLKSTMGLGRLDTDTSIDSGFSSERLSSPSGSIEMPSPLPKQVPSRTIDDFEVIKSLGEGAYGYVRLVKYKNDPSGKAMILKYIVRNRILQDCWMRDKSLGGLIPVEIHILHKMTKYPHQNITQLIEFFQDMDFFYMVTEKHGDGMDLFDYIEQNQQMSENDIRMIFRQVVEAVHHLHKHNIVHRDIKDENVIINEDRIIQLIDFGSAAYLNSSKKFDTFYGTVEYSSPEVLTGHKYEGPPQDVWALGVLLYTLVYKENPFYNIDEIISGDLRIPFLLTPECISLIQYILQRDIKKRPTVEEILQHPWLNPDPGCAVL